MIPGIVAGRTGEYIPPAGASRVSITVPNASIGATLAGFPVYVDLSDMPSHFWDSLAHDDGGDIRVKTAAGANLPFDLYWIDRANQRGALFYKQTLTDGGSTVAYLHYGDAGNALVPPSASNGRYATWTDYERVFLFGDDVGDRCGNQDLSPLNASTLPRGLENTTTSADLGAHQGVAWDGTYYYVVDTNSIKKYDASFSLVASNTDPCGDVTTMGGRTVNHCGDPCLHNGYLYVPIEIYTSISVWSNMTVARFDPATLALVDVFDVSAQNHEVSSICYCPEDGLIYVTSYADNTKLFQYDPDDLSYIGSLSLSGYNVSLFQGITWWRNAFWISAGSASGVSRCDYDGTRHLPSFYVSSGIAEGLEAYGDEGLLLLHDTTGSSNGVVRRLVPYRLFAGGGVQLGASATSQQYIAKGVTRFTTWSIGASVRFASLAGNSAMVSYDADGSTGSTLRETLVYRSATFQVGLWNTTDTWLMSTATIVPNTVYRYNVTHNGTSDRKIYKDGGSVQVDSGVAQKPSVGADALYLGTGFQTSTETMSGLLGFVYLRDGELSAEWIAAEYANISSPSDFYIVGNPEEIGG